MEAENIGYGRGTTDDRHVALVEIMERPQMPLAPQSRTDCLCRVGTPLHCHLRDAGQLIPFLINAVGQIADDENVRIVRNREVTIDLDAAAAIGLRLGTLG